MRRALPWLLVLLAAPLLGQSTPPPAAAPGVDPAAVLGLPAGAPRTGAALAAATETVASKLRCPVCQGLSVAASHTDTALAMKAEIQTLLAEGYGEDQVLAWFEASYGEFILLEPKAEGFNLLVWTLPVLGLLLGAGLIAWRTAHGRRSVPATATAADRVTATKPPADDRAAGTNVQTDDDTDTDDDARADSGDDSSDPATATPADADVDPDLRAYLERVRREARR